MDHKMTNAVINSPRSFLQLPVGGGGFMTGFDQHADGTLVARSDVGGHSYGTHLKENGKFSLVNPACLPPMLFIMILQAVPRSVWHPQLTNFLYKFPEPRL